MSAYGKLLRKVVGGYLHHCPGCETNHFINTHRDPDFPGKPCWSFNENPDSPTFSPSVRIREKKREFDNGEWTGEWVKDVDGNLIDHCCHYFIRNGQIEFCSDSTHTLAGQTVSLPDLSHKGG